MREKEKLLITNNFSFSHNVFDSYISLLCQNAELRSNGLMIYITLLPVVSHFHVKKVPLDLKQNLENDAVTVKENASIFYNDSNVYNCIVVKNRYHNLLFPPLLNKRSSR